MEKSVEQFQVLDQATLDRVRQMAKSSLYFFSKGVLGYDKFDKEIHGKICEAFQNEANTEFLIVLPRGWFKSTLVSICYPLWRAINDPNKTFLLTQNTARNAEAKLSVIKNIVETNEIFRLLFPELLPDDSCVWRSNSLELKRSRKTPESTFESTGVGGAIVGRHYDEVIEDDTVAPDFDDMTTTSATPKKEDIEKAIGYHNALASIIQIGGRSIVVGTRWAEKDLISHIRVTMGSDLFYVERAAREKNGVADERGELTFPAYMDDKVLEKLLRKWGPYMFSCLYLNKPIRSDDMIFQQSWIRYFEREPLGLQITTSVDLANDPDNLQSSDPDWTVVITTGKDPKTGFIYVLDYTRERCNPGRQVEIVFEHQVRWKPLKVKIPKVAYEQSLMYWIREKMHKTGIFINVVFSAYGKTSKHVRILGLQPVFASGVIFLRHWMNDLVSELLAFPIGAHDDIIDALADQLSEWNLTIGEDVFVPARIVEPLAYDIAAREIRAMKDELVEDQQFTTYLLEQNPLSFTLEDQFSF